MKRKQEKIKLGYQKPRLEKTQLQLNLCAGGSNPMVATGVNIYHCNVGPTRAANACYNGPVDNQGQVGGNFWECNMGDIVNAAKCNNGNGFGNMGTMVPCMAGGNN